MQRNLCLQNVICFHLVPGCKKLAGNQCFFSICMKCLILSTFYLCLVLLKVINIQHICDLNDNFVYTYIFCYILYMLLLAESRWLTISQNSTICCLVKSCPTLHDPIDQSTPGPPVFHYLPEFGQIHVAGFDDTVHPSRPLLSPSLAFTLSQHQGLFQDSTIVTSKSTKKQSVVLIYCPIVLKGLCGWFTQFNYGGYPLPLQQAGHSVNCLRRMEG